MIKNKALIGIISFLFLAACGGGSSTSTSTPSAPPVTTGSQSTTSGGMATLNTGSAVIGFVPNGAKLSAVTLEGKTPGSLVKGALKEATISVTATFDIDSCSADAIGSGTSSSPSAKVVCVGFTSSKVAIVDASSFIASGGTLTATEVDLGSSVPQINFSGGACYNCGVLTDPGNGRFIVASGDGYRVLKYSDNTATGTATVNASFLSSSSTTPPTTLATENFSFYNFDSANAWIISPDYGTPTNHFIWIVNINTGKVYHSVKNLNSTDIPSLTSIGIATLSEPDSSSIDSTKVLAIADEDVQALLLVDLSTASFTDPSGGNPGTFSGEVYTAVPLNNIGSRIPGIALASGHYLFMEEEFSDGMGVFQLPTSSPAGAAITVVDADYNWASVPNASSTCSGISSWANFGDPHGIGVFTSNTGSIPVGVLINSDKTCLATVNLSGFKTATKESGVNRVDASVNLVSSGIVTFEAITP